MTPHSSHLAIRLPSGQHASFEEMQTYGNVLQAFICEQEEILARVADAKRHDDTVDYLQSLANGYNEQLRLYKRAESQRERHMIMALMRVVSN